MSCSWKGLSAFLEAEASWWDFTGYVVSPTCGDETRQRLKAGEAGRGLGCRAETESEWDGRGGGGVTGPDDERAGWRRVTGRSLCGCTGSGEWLMGTRFVREQSIIDDSISEEAEGRFLEWGESLLSWVQDWERAALEEVDLVTLSSTNRYLISDEAATLAVPYQATVSRQQAFPI